MESSVTPVPFGKVTAPGAVKIYEGREVIKVFKDPLFPTFRVFKMEGAGRRGFWEDDPTKIQKLIDAFKNGHNIKNACIYAGIEEKAWYRFLEVYPSFRDIKAACEAQTSFRTMNSFQEAIPTKPDLAFKYMEKRGDFNFKPSKVDDEKPLQPTIVVPVQINNNIKNEEIEDNARRVATEFVSSVSREGTASSD